MEENNILNIEGKEPGYSNPEKKSVVNNIAIVRRIFAFIIDNIILAVIYLFIIILFGNNFLFRIILKQTYIILFLYLLLFIHQFYFFIFEFIGDGRTPGKWLFGIKVISKNNNKINFINILTRNFLRAIYFLPPFFFIPDFICLLVTAFNSRIGDLAAGSKVVK